MVSQLKYCVKYALGRDIADGRFTVFPDDIFLASYPRSGNTWARFLLANLIFPNEDVSFTSIGRLVADPARSSKKFLNNLSRPRILKSHHPFDSRYRKVIYLVRDPRDVVISEYFNAQKKMRIDSRVSLDQYVEQFVAGESSFYGSWWENVASWIAVRQGHPSFLLIRYEDLLRRTLHEVSRITEFLSINVSVQRMGEVVNRSSFDQMRELEQKQADLWDVTKDTRKDIPFIRSAKAGGWKTSLSQRSAHLIESAWSPLMSALGYEATGELAEMPESASLAALDRLHQQMPSPELAGARMPSAGALVWLYNPEPRRWPLHAAVGR